MGTAAQRNFKKEWIMSAAIIVASIAAASAGFYYFSGDLAANSAKIIEDKNFIAQQTVALNTLASLKSDAAASVAYTTAMQQLLPTHDNLIGFLPWVNSLGAAHHVSLNVNFNGKNTAASLNIPGSDGFSIAANGALSDIAAVLNDMETQPQYIASIDSFDLGASGGVFSFSAQGRVFSR